MSKCKNCYHQDICVVFLDGSEMPECDYFKDKSLIVELPCKVGDTLYVHGCCDESIEEYDVLFPSMSYKRHGVIDHVSVSAMKNSFGKTVFLTRAEAEKALEDRKNE